MRFTFLIITTLFVCQRQEVKETPLAIVIKLQSAESNMKFDEAKKYIDINSVFKNYPKSKDPEKEWRESVTFFYNIGSTKKFTNQFKYYNYSIIESVSGDKAEVKFEAINKSSHLKEIVYSLHLKDENWQVVKIKYRR